MAKKTNADTVNPDASNQEMDSNDLCTKTPQVSEVSGYEKCRQERIKENLERMQKLGIYDLSLKLKSIKPNTRRSNNKPISQKTPQHNSPVPSSVPTRRSSRLQNTPAVSYSEVHLSKGKDDDYDEVVRENSKPEIYTEEHEKLLGDTKMEWTLFADGCGKDGKRIYDPVRGKTCHQCRQKTLGHRTHCIKCNMVQGQFCGDCLYMRYGENVLEAKQNPNWICPVCRGICNCSLCRQAKGWAPTGILYRKISSMGYKSVAHYLIQTRRSDPDSEKNAETKVPVTAKRSLPFSKEEPESEENNTICEENKDKKLNETQSPNEEYHNNVKIRCGSEIEEKKADAPFVESQNEVEVKKDCEVQLELRNPTPECKDNNTDIEKADGEADESRIKFDKENKVYSQLTYPGCKDNKTDDEVDNNIVTPVTGSGSRKKRRIVMEPASRYSIAGRLRQRKEADKKVEVDVMDDGKQTSVSEQCANMEPSSASSARVDSIAGRLRSRSKCL